MLNVTRLDSGTAFMKLQRQIIEAVTYSQTAHLLLTFYLQTCLVLNFIGEA